MDIGIALLLVFMFMILAGIPIAVSLGLSTIVTMVIYGIPLTMYLNVLNAGLAKYTLLAVPFFILAGFVMERVGISSRIVKFAKIVIGPIPGGLALVSVMVTMFWGAISGSGPATVAALGTILIPAMIKEGYNKGFAAALVAACSAVAVVIPPSINLVVYGVIAGDSIGTLFIAGVMPGIVMGICFMVYAFIYSVRHGYKGEKRGSLREILVAFQEAFWGLLSPLIILGGIYGGFFTPTEAAVVSVLYCLLVDRLIYKELKLADFWRVLGESGLSSATIMIIMANAAVFTWLIQTEGVATRFNQALLSVSDSSLAILMLINLILIIAGVFIDGISIQYIFIPLLLPVVKELGMSSIWFGVTMTMAIAIGFATPPVAVNLYPACRIAGIDLLTISRQVIGFIVAGLVALIIVTIFPDIILWFPRMLGMPI